MAEDDTSEHPGNDAARPTAPPIYMRGWERFGALLAGAILDGAGVLSVFHTSNQAGSAALIVGGAAFLLIGVQGTRLVKFSGGGNSIEMDRLEVANQVVKQATQEPRAEVADALGEAAAKISPATVDSPSVAARRYEDELYEALLRAGATVKRDVRLGPSVGMVDFSAEIAGRRVLVEALPRRYGLITTVDVETSSNRLAGATGDAEDAGFLIVTNSPLSGGVQQLNALGERVGRPIEVITWNDSRDDNLLKRALLRVAR